MFEITQVSIAPATRAAVLRNLKARGIARAMDLIVEEALQAWLLKAACDDPPAAQAAARGYQWKSLFLPEGILVRFSYRRQTYHAHVRGDELMYQGQAYSPRQLLLFVTGTVRNAWRELWLRSPGDARWHLADTRRHILRRTAQGLHPRGVDLAPHHSAVRQGVSTQADVAQLAPAQPGMPQEVPVQPGLSQVAPGQPAIAQGKPAPPDVRPAPPTAGKTVQLRFPVSLMRAAQLRAILYRDDLVRDDQPDLRCGTGGGGRCRAGRSGPRDRRYCGYLFDRR